ncbi:Class A basic helix-loop-helix protein [Trichinella spiralis]|uniref:Class A basic helix-loop-helix protein n=1 Tax=Trichinella spiralis TaxID=6334 RepID=A0ABR3K670_TRISP
MMEKFEDSLSFDGKSRPYAGSGQLGDTWRGVTRTVLITHGWAEPAPKYQPPMRTCGATASRFRPSVVRRRDLPGWIPSCFCSPCILLKPLQWVCHADEDVPSFIHTRPTFVIARRESPLRSTIRLAFANVDETIRIADVYKCLRMLMFALHLILVSHRTKNKNDNAATVNK